MHSGFTFLELLITLSLIALLALIALPQYQDFLARQQQNTEIQQVLKTLTMARQQALLLGQTVSVCPYLAHRCGQDWSQGLRVVQKAGIEETLIMQQPFSGDATILLKTFPQGSEYAIPFTAQGFTSSQNGSFYYCPKNSAQAKRIVFNQAGRAYVTGDGASEGCFI